MKLQEFLQMCVLLACKGDGEGNYDNVIFHTPRIHCKDGFTISIQVNNGNYCSSENGYRTYGEKWERAEWGYPNKPIDGIKYHCEMWNDEDYTDAMTTDSVGSAGVEELQGLLDEHGGIDVVETFKNGWEMIGKYFTNLCIIRQVR